MITPDAVMGFLAAFAVVAVVTVFVVALGVIKMVRHGSWLR